MAKSKYIEALEEQYTKKDAKSVLRYKAPDNKWRYVQTSKDASGGNMPSGGGMTEVTWQELKDKRDNGQLIAGSLYRITDYNCTTTQENTRSAGHQFDIVLLALSENKLAEEGWAMMHIDNIYKVVFDDNEVVSCYVTPIENQANRYYLVNVDTLLGADITITSDRKDEDNKVITLVRGWTPDVLDTPDLPYNYFQNSKLEAWKVWYCLDNDKSKFAWADDSVDESTEESIDVSGDYSGIFIRNSQLDTHTSYCWTKTEGDRTYNIYTSSLTPTSGDTYRTKPDERPARTNIINSYTPAHEGTGLPNGRGVIYRLVDEFNNDIKYDFKNIQFKRKITDGQYDANGTETWCYTLNIWYNNMCQDASIVGNILPNDEGYVTGVYDNIFGYATAYDLSIDGVNKTFAFALGNNVVLSFVDSVGVYYGSYSNTIGNNFFFNTIGHSFYSNTIENNFNYNTIGISFAGNKIGNYFNSNTIGDYFSDNTIGNSFYGRTISVDTNGKNYGNNGVELATKI